MLFFKNLQTSIGNDIVLCPDCGRGTWWNASDASYKLAKGLIIFKALPELDPSCPGKKIGKAATFPPFGSR